MSHVVRDVGLVLIHQSVEELCPLGKLAASRTIGDDQGELPGGGVVKNVRDRDDLPIIETMERAAQRWLSKLRVLENVHGSEHLDLQRVSARAEDANLLRPGAPGRPRVRPVRPYILLLGHAASVSWTNPSLG
jgi:hypothetical protein